MLIHELLTESFPYPPGSEMPDWITDFRDPSLPSKGKKIGSYYDRRRTHIVLTKTGGVIVYYYATGNTIDWRALLETLSRDIDRSLQEDIFGIIVLRTGYLVDRSRDFGSWSGDRNRYSIDLQDTAKALLDRGIATPSTPIWIGNWAAGKGEHIGTVRSILSRRDRPDRLPSRMTLYHGTSSYRLAEIMRNGLRPLPLEDRVWNKGGLEKNRPAHRDNCVYLTASRPQAEYYAKKATNIDRARKNRSQRDAIRGRISWLCVELTRLEWGLDHDQYPDDYAVRQRVIVLRTEIEGLEAKMYYGKFEPVILQVTIPRSEFSNLMADDDFLRGNQAASPSDWIESLSHFGQIAYLGTIPPEKIKVIAQGKDAGQISR